MEVSRCLTISAQQSRSARVLEPPVQSTAAIGFSAGALGALLCRVGELAGRAPANMGASRLERSLLLATQNN